MKSLLMAILLLSFSSVFAQDESNWETHHWLSEDVFGVRVWGADAEALYGVLAVPPLKRPLNNQDEKSFHYAGGSIVCVNDEDHDERFWCDLSFRLKEQGLCFNKYETLAEIDLFDDLASDLSSVLLEKGLVVEAGSQGGLSKVYFTWDRKLVLSCTLKEGPRQRKACKVQYRFS